MNNGIVPAPFKDLFSEFFNAPPAVFAPAMDVFEDDEGYTLNLELPGVASENVAVECDKGEMIIRGEKKWQSPEPLRSERVYGPFERRITLTENVDETRITAALKDGVLSIRVPKKPESKPRKVQIEVK